MSKKDFTLDDMLRLGAENSRLKSELIQLRTEPVGYWTRANEALTKRLKLTQNELLDFHNHAIDQEWHDCEGIPGGCPILKVLSGDTE